MNKMDDPFGKAATNQFIILIVVLILALIILLLR